MEYLAIYFEENHVIKVLSRAEKMDVAKVNEVLAAIKKQGYSTARLKKPSYDPRIQNDEEINKVQKEKEFYERLSRFGEDGTINFDEAVEVKK